MVLLFPQEHWLCHYKLPSTKVLLRGHTKELVDQEHGWVEPKGLDRLDKHTNDEDRRPTKKPTLNIN